MAILISTNPGKNYKKLGGVDISTQDEIRNKVEKANSARKTWRSLGVEGRIKLLRRIVDKLKENKDELALLETQEMGMPIAQIKLVAIEKKI